MNDFFGFAPKLLLNSFAVLPKISASFPNLIAAFIFSSNIRGYNANFLFTLLSKPTKYE